MEKHSVSDWIEAILSRFGYGSDYKKNKKIHKVENMLGVDFGGQLFQDNLGFRVEQGNDYTASPDWITTVLDGRITEEDSIIDFGCGKGYAMYLMSQFPFKKIYGIELSTKLYDMAKHNFYILKDDRFRIWNLDATKLSMNEEVYSILGECKYIYIYNSFPLEVMKKVVNELEEKVIKDSWNVFIIYVSPTPECRMLLDSSTKFKLNKRYYEDEPGGGVFEYESIPL